MRWWASVAKPGQAGLAPTNAQDALRIAVVVNGHHHRALRLRALRIAILSANLDDNAEVRQRLVLQVLRTPIDERLNPRSQTAEIEIDSGCQADRPTAEQNTSRRFGELP
jgi:hypothetical protein